MKKKIFINKGVEWIEAKGQDLSRVNSVLTTETMTLKEMKKSKPDMYKTLKNWLGL